MDAHDEYDDRQGSLEEGQYDHTMAQQTSGSFSNVAQGLTGHHREVMIKYWQDTINSIEHDEHKFKIHQLPLARIKKVMKADEDVRMISAEAPILFAKGCHIFITELTMRAWIHAEENKRRTLQRSDIAAALQKSDMFDFLIDIVPREEALGARRAGGHLPPAEYDDMAEAPLDGMGDMGPHDMEHDIGHHDIGHNMGGDIDLHGIQHIAGHPGPDDQGAAGPAGPPGPPPGQGDVLVDNSTNHQSPLIHGPDGSMRQDHLVSGPQHQGDFVYQYGDIEYNGYRQF